MTTPTLPPQNPEPANSNDASTGEALVSHRDEVLQITNYLEALCARLYRLTNGHSPIEVVSPASPDSEH